MSSSNESNGSTSKNMHHKSFFIVLSARALGSVGLGVSVLFIWLRWLVPSAVLAASGNVPAPKPRRHRRHTSLPPFAIPTIEPITLPIMIHSGDDNFNLTYRSKHVYFTDSPQSRRPPPSRSNTPAVISPEGSLEPAYRPNTPTILLTYEESIAESTDSSSRSSSLSSHLPKLMQPLGGKTRHTTGSPLAISITAVQTSYVAGTQRPPKRSSSLVASPSSRNFKSTDTDPDRVLSRSPFLFRRPSTPRSVSSSADTVVSSPFPLKASLKQQRRVSAPVPRTRPYEAPYFAAPPFAVDPKKVRQPPDDSSRREVLAALEVLTEAPRGRSSNVKSGVTPCVRSRTLCKRRSASESWIDGRRTLKQS